MKKQLVIIGIVAVLVCVGLSGCNQVSNTLNGDEGKFVGTWNGTSSGILAINVSIMFFSNGSGYNSSPKGNSSMIWTIKEGNLTINSNGITNVFHYSFTNNDRTLILTDSTGQITLVLDKK